MPMSFENPQSEEFKYINKLTVSFQSSLQNIAQIQQGT